MLPLIPPGAQKRPLVLAGSPQEHPAPALQSLDVQAKSLADKHHKAALPQREKSWHLKFPAASCNFGTAFPL